MAKSSGASTIGDLKIIPSTCSECSVHCGSLIHVRDDVIESIKPNPARAHDDKIPQRRDHGTVSSPLELLTVPGALKLLRAYGRLNNGRMRRSIVDVVNNIAAGRR
jgi:hypothetical protein